MSDTLDLERHRTALRGHCYRMLGGSFDADDAVQETLIRAWKNLGGFEGRSSMRTWLYRIATNVCLDALASRSRREDPVAAEPIGTIASDLVSRPRSHWLEPIPDAMALPTDGEAAERIALRQSIRMAFVAALQHLPARQRAVLLLTQVLGWSATETADGLDMSVAAVNSALQRARATLAARGLSPDAPAEMPPAASPPLVDRFVDAFERYDVDAIVGLLRDDATLSMPPYTLWLRGKESIHAWLLGPGAPCRGSWLVEVEANGVTAFAQYRASEGGRPHHAWSLVLLATEGEQITAMTYFLEPEALFARFGLPPELAQRPQ